MITKHLETSAIMMIRTQVYKIFANVSYHNSKPLWSSWIPHLFVADFTLSRRGIIKLSQGTSFSLLHHSLSLSHTSSTFRCDYYYNILSLSLSTTLLRSSSAFPIHSLHISECSGGCVCERETQGEILKAEVLNEAACRAVQNKRMLWNHHIPTL